MELPTDQESRAIEKLIAEIDQLDAYRDRVGRRVILAFICTFALALGLLVYVALTGGPGRRLLRPPGPRVPGVLQAAPR
ncbi:hypothetical protein [uncultured Paludibaculum sp.]|uniref:hypothetical protein n=1 Tax=uncultured Paludibaculum sp. TaxID=1765020 RepID=UPI002AABA507|nr:hypothetical protein [uncultured Paludibaculum sp.]